MFWKQFLKKNHGFESHFALLYIYTFSFYSGNGDTFFYNNFFNYLSNFCYTTYFGAFFLECSLFLYILYQILFFHDKKKNYMVYYFQYIYFLISIAVIFFFFHFSGVGSLITMHFVCNKYTSFCKLIIVLLMIMILFICCRKFTIAPFNSSLNELPTVFSFLMLFIFILLSSYDFFVIYLCIEGISLIIYSLGSLMNRSLINLEAIIKYFLVNNMASSFLLWAISYLYILLGTTDCFELQYFLISNLENVIINNLYVVVLIIILSITFKLALFPFQWWIADVFEGLWTPITLIYAVILKITFFLFFFKVLWSFCASILFFLQPFLWLSAVGSLIYGSLGALIQVKIKRFLAFTSIAQSGYIMMGLACDSFYGSVSSVLFLLMYCLITLSFFIILLNIENLVNKNNMSYLNQLYSIVLYNKEVGFHLILIILVMAAIPPFSSFFAKLFILMAGIEAKADILILIVLAVTLVSTFYYLNFIQQLVFFKYKTQKLFYFKETTFNLIFLRINSFIFLFSFTVLPWIFHLGCQLVYSCMLNLTC